MPKVNKGPIDINSKVLISFQRILSNKYSSEETKLIINRIIQKVKILYFQNKNWVNL